MLRFGLDRAKHHLSCPACGDGAQCTHSGAQYRSNTLTEAGLSVKIAIWPSCSKLRGCRTDGPSTACFALGISELGNVLRALQVSRNHSHLERL
jgi:hypothetical protein